MLDTRIAVVTCCLVWSVVMGGCKQPSSNIDPPQRDLLVATIDTGGLDPELRWGEFGYYSKWDRYGYEIRSDSPYLGRLADLREFPLLLKAMQELEQDDGARAVILSQIRTLSRCDFEQLLNAGDDVQAAEREALAQWTDWWQHYGSELATKLTTEGKRYPSAWKEIAPSPYLECPSYPLLIPKVWSATILFRSGDYDSVAEEVIEFVVNEDICELRRKYWYGSPSQAQWTHEVWEDFSPEEAEQFLATLIYAIDHPWFYAADELTEKDEHFNGWNIRGRPAWWSAYYPSVEWTGILDADQKVLINDDPWHWDTVDFDVAEQTRLKGGAFGVIFRVVRDFFPDPVHWPGKSRWKKVDAASQPTP